ncbi:MAG: hypothetical protein V7609_1012 [Verrucomicrobiota bacterium]
MKAIVVLFFRTLKPETSEQQLSLPPARTLPASANPGTWTPPFWTWFIENPRLAQGTHIAI